MSHRSTGLLCAPHCTWYHARSDCSVSTLVHSLFILEVCRKLNLRPVYEQKEGRKAFYSSLLQ